jgi:hypothetical protein
MPSLSRLLSAILLAVAGAVTLERLATAEQPRSDGPRIEIVFAKEARAEPVTGMVLSPSARTTHGRR